MEKIRKIKIADAVCAVTGDDDYLNGMRNEFEPHMVKLVRTLISQEDVVADIGANIGLTAILFSSLAAHTYAFEPSPSTFRILSENLARNGIANVEAINLGLGHIEETTTITFAQNNRSGGYVSDKIRPETDHVTEEIRIGTLDHFFASKQPVPTFLKIDVEGFEQNVVRGGGGFLQRARPIVVMEMNHFCLDVLQRITIPDFLDYMCAIFPYLFAIDTDNTAIVDLHAPDKAYHVMHEHVIRHRFSNIVGGFDPTLREKLEALEKEAKSPIVFKRSPITTPHGKMIAQPYDVRVKARNLFEVCISVTNQSKETWYGYGEDPIYLSYHWKKKGGNILIYDGIRTDLTQLDFFPGETLQQKVRVASPDVPGKFQLILTLVQEGVCWFEERGFEPAVLDFEVFL